MDGFLNNSSGKRMSMDNVLREIVSYMRAEPDKNYSVTIGTDSLQLASKNADFVSAVVVRRVGNGARYFWRRTMEGPFHLLRDRIMNEALLSLELAREIIDELKLVKNLPGWDCEIHVDVGTEGETKAMIHEVVGVVRAHDFEVKIKPFSYAASNVADRHV